MKKKRKILLPAAGASVLVPWQPSQYPYLLALETTVYLIESTQQAKLTALKGLFPELVLAWCVEFQICPEEGAANSVIDTERLMDGP